jgi:hypothetical protein
MPGFFGLGRNRKKTQAAVEICWYFTDLLRQGIGSLEERTYSAGSKEALCYCLFLSGALDYIAQQLDRDDKFWLASLEYAGERMGFEGRADLLLPIVVTAHQEMSVTDARYRPIIAGGEAARSFMKGDTFAPCSGVGCARDFAADPDMPASAGHLAIDLGMASGA